MQVVPLYCFDPRQYQLTPFGHPKTGAFRAQFILEAVLDLKASLRRIGSDLLIHMGRPEDVMPGQLPQTSTVAMQAPDEPYRFAKLEDGCPERSCTAA